MLQSPAALVIDVRSDVERGDAHLIGSLGLPYANCTVEAHMAALLLRFNAGTKGELNAAQLLVHCMYSLHRGPWVAEQLQTALAVVAPQARVSVIRGGAQALMNVLWPLQPDLFSVRAENWAVSNQQGIVWLPSVAHVFPPPAVPPRPLPQPAVLRRVAEDLAAAGANDWERTLAFWRVAAAAPVEAREHCSTDVHLATASCVSKCVVS
jgi:hypothetical protein